MALFLKRDDLSVSDLIPGEYEGGFKLWEGAIDLCHYLIEMQNQKQQSLQVCFVFFLQLKILGRI